MKYQNTILTKSHKVSVTRGEDYRPGENPPKNPKKLDASKKYAVCYKGLSYQSCNVSVMFLMLFIQE